MKLKYSFFAALASLGFTACSDFLDVDSVSKYDSEGVFGEKTEINRALNGVYAKLMSGDFYGDAYFTKFVFNSDVCLLYTSDAADDMQCVDLGGRRIIKKKIFSSRRRHTRSLSVSWARRCV